MIAMLSHSCSASSILCVVSKMLEFWSRLIIVNRLRRETGSTPVVGSSRNSILGETNKVIAHDNFLLLPPDRFLANTCTNSDRSSVSMISLLLFSNCSRVRPFTRAIICKFSKTVSWFKIGLYCGHIPILLPCSNKSIELVLFSRMYALPSVKDYSIASMLNEVDFPAPFGPNKPKICPGLTPNVFPTTALRPFS